MKLFSTIYDYLRAFGQVPMPATVFMGWHTATYPQLLTEHGTALFGRIMREFEGLGPEQKMSLAREMLPAAKIVEQQRADKSADEG
jgi:hypothetical protein